MKLKNTLTYDIDLELQLFMELREYMPFYTMVWSPVSLGLSFRKRLQVNHEKSDYTGSKKNRNKPVDQKSELLASKSLPPTKHEEEEHHGRGCPFCPSEDRRLRSSRTACSRETDGYPHNTQTSGADGGSEWRSSSSSWS